MRRRAAVLFVMLAIGAAHGRAQGAPGRDFHLAFSRARCGSFGSS